MTENRKYAPSNLLEEYDKMLDEMKKDFLDEYDRYFQQKEKDEKRKKNLTITAADLT